MHRGGQATQTTQRSFNPPATSSIRLEDNFLEGRHSSAEIPVTLGQRDLSHQIYGAGWRAGS